MNFLDKLTLWLVIVFFVYFGFFQLGIYSAGSGIIREGKICGYVNYLLSSPKINGLLALLFFLTAFSSFFTMYRSKIWEKSLTISLKETGQLNISLTAIEEFINSLKVAGVSRIKSFVKNKKNKLHINVSLEVVDKINIAKITSDFYDDLQRILKEDFGIEGISRIKIHVKKIKRTDKYGKEAFDHNAPASAENNPDEQQNENDKERG